MLKNNNTNDLFIWIEAQLEPRNCTSEEFIYNQMESQSNFSLPIIYQPFDGSKEGHWVDRGYAYDFLHATQGQGKKVLDFGPGDGWPSLIVAPYVQEVVGVDASPKRVQICGENAKRLGITNASFYTYVADQPLPFEDESFDAIMASTSIEQTPNPKATLHELYRVLKPGGRLRFKYEGLNGYRNGEEKDLWIYQVADNITKIILFDRHIDDEYVRQYGITLNLALSEVRSGLVEDYDYAIERFDQAMLAFFQDKQSLIRDTQVLKTVHPSGRTFVKWLSEIGFSVILPTYQGGLAARRLYHQYLEPLRPLDFVSINEQVERIVKVVIELEAPLELDPMITAIK